MKYTISSNQIEKTRSECLIIGVFEDKKPQLQLEINQAQAKSYIQKILQHNDMQGKVGQTSLLYHVPGINSERILLVGCGKKTKLDESQYKKILASTASALKQTQISEAACFLSQLPLPNRNTYWKVRFAVETISQTLYEFLQFKTQKPKLTPAISHIKLAVESRSEVKEAEQAVIVAEAIAKAAHLCRDLANTPPSICTPTYLADKIHHITNSLPLTQTAILEEADMQRLGMNCILAVGRGSHEPSKFIEVHYQGGKKTDKPIVLVGKGVTFDAGGLCIKTSQGMFDMKMDMTGAATMFSVLTAAANLKLPINVIALLPCVENLPDGKAFKPGDVLTSLSGKTIEVIDTDAEGRLILCDALTYAERYNPSVVIDAATLTGAVVVALGHHLTAVLSNDEALRDDLMFAGKISHDQLWPLPINDDYQAQLDSKIADMSNLSSDRTAGTITAACFLARFAEKYKWAHLDIAGTAMVKSASTGRTIAMLVQYLLLAAEQKSHAKG